MADRDEQTGDKKKSHLTTFIVAAIVLAVATALLIPWYTESVLDREATDSIAVFHAIGLGGEVFLRLLKMMVVPLVIASVMGGILGLGDIRKLGRPGGYAVLYYLSTTILAVVVGLVVVNVIRPGVGTVSEEKKQQIGSTTGSAAAKKKVLEKIADGTDLKKETVAEALPDLKDGLDSKQPSLGTILHNLVLMLFTENLFESAVKMDLLPLIVFSVLFAGMLTTMGDRVRVIVDIVEQINHALMSFILLLMRAAPIGIFCLVAARFGEAQARGEFVAELQQTGWYVTTVLAGLGLHAFVTLPIILWVFTRRNPYVFMYQMSQALLTAFSTASSSATLPVTMECANMNAGVSERSTEFVLPLGATINMDGTALYEAAAAIFIAQVIGADLSMTQQLTIAVTATLAAIGAAGIPEAGLFTMMIVLNAVNLPAEYIALILPVDWLLDRFRTAVNAFGDSAEIGTAAVDRTLRRCD
eukprot:g26669.t1